MLLFGVDLCFVEDLYQGKIVIGYTDTKSDVNKYFNTEAPERRHLGQRQFAAYPFAVVKLFLIKRQITIFIIRHSQYQPFIFGENYQVWNLHFSAKNGFCAL